MALTVPERLRKGVRQLINQGVVATGVAVAQWFVMSPTGVESAYGVNYNVGVLPTLVSGVAATTMTGDLEYSLDGGVTWGKLQTGLALVIAAVTQAVTGFLFPADVIFRLNITVFTGGTNPVYNIYLFY